MSSRLTYINYSTIEQIVKIMARRVGFERAVGSGRSGIRIMSQQNANGCPYVFIDQLEDMIAFADAREDFALAAWLSQALDRFHREHTDR